MSSSSRNILYIGLHGYAGSGKDTVAKALRLMLSYPWESFEDFKKTWEQEAFKRSYATFNEGFSDDGNPVYGNATLEDTKVYCIAFADQLKHICAEMFGIPVKLENDLKKMEPGGVNVVRKFLKGKKGHPTWKIAEFYKEDVKELDSRIRELKDAAREYTSFSGAASDMNSTVKFIIKADTIA